MSLRLSTSPKKQGEGRGGCIFLLNLLTLNKFRDKAVQYFPYKS